MTSSEPQIEQKFGRWLPSLHLVAMLSESSGRAIVASEARLVLGTAVSIAIRSESEMNGFPGTAPRTVTDLSTYTLESLRRDAEFVLYRGRKDADPRHILVVAPVSEEPSQGTLKRLEHEYALRTELDDPAWTARPLALVRDKGLTLLVLEDPGGAPLDRLLGQPLELTQFLHIAIGLAVVLGNLYEQEIIHKDIRPANFPLRGGESSEGEELVTGLLEA
jgi:hypothetical protein